MIGKNLMHSTLGRCVVTKIVSETEVEVSFPDLGLVKKRHRLCDLADPSTKKAPVSPIHLVQSQVDGRAKPVATIEANTLRARLAIPVSYTHLTLPTKLEV